MMMMRRSKRRRFETLALHERANDKRMAAATRAGRRGGEGRNVSAASSSFASSSSSSSSSFPSFSHFASSLSARKGRRSRSSAENKKGVSVRMCAIDASNSSEEVDLLVVGPGVLGTRVARQWQQRGLGLVHGKTRSHETRDRIMKGSSKDCPFASVLVDWDEVSKSNNEKLYKYVVFSAPPSGNEDYARCVAEAADVVDWEKNGTRSLQS